MNRSEIIKNYLNSLELSDYEKLISLFTEDAIVYSPLYGEILASKFYKDLFEDTSKSKITLLNILMGEDERVAAGHFRYDWTLANGTPTCFECVDIFNFSPEGKIKELRIIYDSAKTRSSFEKLNA